MPNISTRSSEENESNNARTIDDALIEEITRKIVDAFHPQRVILFGSRARGDYRADSDIDLFVEMESNEKPWKRRTKVRSLFDHQWWPMDILVYTPQEVAERQHSLISIVPVIEKEGRVLFEHNGRS
ncbi:MAG TPA: nucleotidyltransferase domain-containing protein [Candidatus Kapabacteria bacterium]|nr:nucleotidyltransferase domain-containing protein [Candidatus Kapabacteria bacterium]